ncbi:MAG TPA: bifunctional demethylmenaquinone methyltransferase/2-methoxy-6-polyprenyl-1,4-benzoquinol methylase UbiE [Bryobacteraceae bacterium]|nr:bifunctional demethylmenaquinone methyltransferase/2-methoxy-6-polyprenyl-1,4-benzoquinol methylase UbiE [Bryobacteraceae bacterium]
MKAGTTPPGVSNEPEAAEWVQRMFSRVASRYDFLNHLLSFNIDRSWRRVLMERMRDVLRRPEAKILDLCCGTGDVQLDFQTVAKAPIFGADFCHPMLVSAKRKATERGLRPLLFEADALRLPIADSALDAISIAFGFRNLANYQTGLCELHRVLKPGGLLAILEFSHPAGVFMKTAYGFYSSVLLPLIGTAISGSKEAYTYLPDSIRKFPRAAELCEMMRRAGFEEPGFELLTGGIAALHLGHKSAGRRTCQSPVDLVP